VRFEKLEKNTRLIAGLDCAFSKDKKRICAVIIVLTFPDMKVVETRHAVTDVAFPYIPGLLSFREAPVCIKAASKLRSVPDLFMIDGQGSAHPRRMGLACHLGLFFDKPAIGCAKSRLIGTFDKVGIEKGDYSVLKDKGQTVGAVLRTRKNVRPMFVSVGNKCLLEDAIRVVLACATKYRLPEPTRLAHQAVSRLKPDI
jgi:deoxyribonuclease V